MEEPRARQGETRYAKQQEKLHQQQRHASIAQRLGRSTVDEFEQKILTAKTPCIDAGTPSEWTDWDIEPENREPQDGKMPTAHRARQMCEGCPVMDDDLCYRYALATNKEHGVWGGRRFHNGIIVSDNRDSSDTPNRERPTRERYR